jgi:hypothetical protein
MIFDRMLGSVKTIIEKIHFYHFNRVLSARLCDTQQIIH